VTTFSIALEDLLRKTGVDDLDFLREGLQVLAQGLMELEVSQRIAADRYERSYIDLPGGIWQLEINSGFKWNVAFTIDLSQWYLPSFSGGHTQQYGGQKMAEYSVSNWKSYIKRYRFFDRDNSKKTWYVTLEEY